MRINNNIPALNTHRMLGITNSGLEKTLERLSSGKRINKASDDAAGLAISQKMDAQIRGLRQASRNSLDGVSLLQTAEGALNEVHSMLQRMRELAIQGANGIYEEGENGDLNAIANEMKELTEQIDKIANDTEFNGIKLLNGENKTIELQIGANSGQSISIDMSEINIIAANKKNNKRLGILGDVVVKSGDDFIIKSTLNSTKFNDAITTYDDAIRTVASHRSKLGAYQNRLEHTIRNVDNTAENLTSAKSRIEDADMALQMSEYVKLNILQQAGTSMLSKANQLPQTVLQLLQQ
ncbi:flagellin [Schnuerera sp. xch1]|uniref:flagellin N-terminal helical domain-containing protein n=1 Tax=Schnuerera sp. xch1 TaxID=2874283 RepID=UPI001CC0D817|nr:flagellin [Schnuerera sp. xch1]MBZ2175446.1 flagellin [Schnuerera sp. xch1]